MIRPSHISVVLLAMGHLAMAQEQIIPKPVSVVYQDEQTDSFILNKHTQFVSTTKDKAFNDEINRMIKFLHQGTGLSFAPVKVSSHKPTSGIIFKLSDKLKESGKDAYQLTVNNQSIEIEAASPSGIFYAFQSLAQMLPPEFYSSQSGEKAKTTWKLDCKNVVITDYPRFAWREFMLDEARHFYGADAFKKLIDEMAKLKMNVLHWHLTDHQGWRIEIKKYPKLTSVGGTRRDTQVGTWKSDELRGEPHSGFYTQEQIKELVQYAKDRHITIIPEIDIPGHSAAAVASYPELNLSVTPVKEVPITFDEGASLDPTEEGTYQFISDVFDEIIPLFPSRIIHIGGDEVRYLTEWKSDKVDKYMKNNGFEKYTDLQIYFTNRISKMLAEKGCRTMGWNEILGSDIHNDGGQGSSLGKLDPNAIIHYWYGPEKLVKEAIEKGHQVVVSSSKYTYMNRPEIDLKQAYSFEPVFNCVDEKVSSKILGLGCNLWTEWLGTSKEAQTKIFPRLAAYAETAWTPQQEKNYEKFEKRLPHYQQGLDKANISYGQYSPKK